jgi:UDP-GlcNAc:undecaprenyl-phosphate GlcNAc-1-phosphate transferase
VHQTVPVYIPLLLPLSIIAVPAADLISAIVRRTWRGQSPFAADRGHLHHRLLEIGHSHSRAVWIMYFWSALIAFGSLAYSVNSASMWIVLGVVFLSTIGLVLLLLPRFTPRVPTWAQAVVPPRYRRRRPVVADSVESVDVEQRTPVAVGVAGVNGATALRAHSHAPERRKAETSR